MSEKFTQKKRHISLNTPLGTDVLLLKSFQGREAVSEAFEYSLELQSEDPNIAFKDVVGHPVTVSIALPGGGTRFISGYVNTFRFVHQGGYLSSYHMTVVPKLWLLTQTRDCRVFQQMAIPAILEEVLQEHGVTDYELQLSSSYREWEYCVQYRETDFNFLNRLMEQEGIYYYFTHEDGAHTMVLCDTASNIDPFPDYEKVANRTMGKSGKSEVREDYFQPQIWGWAIEQRVRSGKVSLNDYNFTSPKASMLSDNSVEQPHGEAGHEIYDYPGEFSVVSEGKHYAKVRMESLAAGHEIGTAKTDARGLATGHMFDLTDHPRKDQNRSYFITATELHADAGGFDQHGEDSTMYEARIEVIPHDTPFRASQRSTKSLVEGPQTAVVTGPSGEEIHCDEHGRVKIQFHWDRLGEKNENSSCWVRVSQIHAGKGWGSMHLPRIGEEVVVSFLEGDPDQPMITGRVYNADNKPAYELPANKTRSGYQSRSTKGGGAANFNELTFEDKKGDEQVYMHAEKDMDTHIENCETRFVGVDRKKDIGNDETTTVGNDREESVGNDETITIGNNREESVGVNETINIGVTRKTSIGVNEELTVGAERKKTVGAGETNTIMAKRTTTVVGPDSETVAGPKSCTVAGPYNVTATGGFNLIAPGGTNIVDMKLWETGGSHGDIYASKTTIVGTKVDLVAGAATSVINTKIDMVNFKIDNANFKMANEPTKVVTRTAAMQMIANDVNMDGIVVFI